jgi:hypothetical protein
LVPRQKRRKALLNKITPNAACKVLKKAAGEVSTRRYNAINGGEFKTERVRFEVLFG